MDETHRFWEPARGNSGGWPQERIAKIPEYKADIVEGIASGLFASEICQSLQISPVTVRKWRQADREFDEAISDAEAQVTDQLEKEAIRRAKNGVLEPVVSGGRLVLDPETKEPMMTRRYSDGLMQFLLKGRRRDVYGDKREVDAKVGIDVVGARASLEAKFVAASVSVPQED